MGGGQTEWNMLVKKMFKEGRGKNAAYKLKDAMRDAKKVYKKTTSSVEKVGNVAKAAVTGRRRRTRSSSSRRTRRNR